MIDVKKRDDDLFFLFPLLVLLVYCSHLKLQAIGSYIRDIQNF
uniref:Uncharacterized protein n=1 Tax=Rhizophora mucronata TaxID=61149 RepID=A0A2P2IL25_RHIMU